MSSRDIGHLKSAGTAAPTTKSIDNPSTHNAQILLTTQEEEEEEEETKTQNEKPQVPTSSTPIIIQLHKF
jgi:hypothetical protein